MSGMHAIMIIVDKLFFSLFTIMYVDSTVENDDDIVSMILF